MATKITRKYDFVPRTPAKADQVDEEFNQVVTVVNATIDDVDAIELVDAAQDILIAGNISDIGVLETADAAQDILIAANISDISSLESADAAQDILIAANISDISALESADAAQDILIAAKVTGPASSVNENIPLFDGITGKIISDSGKKFTTTLGSPGVDTNIPTEKAVRLAIVSSGGGDVSGPVVAVDNSIARMDGITGKFIKSSPVSIDDSGNVAGVAGLAASGAISGSNLSGSNTGDQTLPTRDSLGLDTDDTVAFANLSGSNTGDQAAADVGITDTGAYYTGTEVETALQEIGAELLAPDETAFTTKLSVTSLPAGTLDGAVSGLIAKGMTLNNLIPNGDFSGGTTGWTANASTLSATGGILTITSNGTSLSVGAARSAGAVSATDKIYVRTKGKVTNSVATLIGQYIYGSTGGGASVVTSTPSQNVDYLTSGIVTGMSGTLNVKIQHNYADAATANGKVAEFDNVMAINLTALGIADYTEAQMLDLVQQGYFEGLTGVENPVIESVGKNLFDKTSATLNKSIYYVDGSISDSTTVAYSDYIKIDVGKNYYLQGLGMVLRVIYYDANKTFISGQDGASGTGGALVIPSTAMYCRFDTLINNLDTAQLEEGSTATTYEPYKSSSLSADVTLNRVPNGVADRIYEADGQIWHEQNVQEYTLVSGDLTALSIGTNVDFVRVSMPSNGIPYSSGVELSASIMVDFSIPSLAYYSDSITLIGKHCYGTGSIAQPLILFVVTKGTYATLAAAQTALAGKVLYYQLATPVITNLTTAGLTSGELLSMESGTLYSSSDTFQAQDVSFNVPSNRAAQIESLFDSANTQAKQIAEKANKAQETVIVPTLVNSFTNTAGVSYYKDDMGRVQLQGTLATGASGASPFTLPTGYRPSVAVSFAINSNNAFGKCDIATTGVVTVTGNTASYYLDGISFKAV